MSPAELVRFLAESSTLRLPLAMKDALRQIADVLDGMQLPDIEDLALRAEVERLRTYKQQREAEDREIRARAMQPRDEMGFPVHPATCRCEGRGWVPDRPVPATLMPPVGVVAVTLPTVLYLQIPCDATTEDSNG